jgi:hypothetical protein
MLNIRMSRTPIEGSPVPGCLTPRRAHILMWSRFVPGTTKCLHPNRGHGHTTAFIFISSLSTGPGEC